MRHYLLVFETNRAPLKFRPVNRFLSLTACAYCPVADCVWPKCGFLTWLDPMRSSSLGESSKLGRGRNIRAIKSDHEAAPKRLRTLLIAKPILAILQGLLPAWSESNDLVRLRAVIITSCISGARKI